MRRVVFGTLAALAVAAPAQAAPSLVSATADGVPVAVSVDEHLGVGTASFQVPPGTGLNAAAVYEIVIDTGAWQAREARVTGRGVSVAISGHAGHDPPATGRRRRGTRRSRRAPSPAPAAMQPPARPKT